MTPEQIKKLVQDEIKKQLAFSMEKLGDTPKDALQLVNKKYVDTHGANPAGSDTQIQFNDGGSFGGNAAFYFNKSTDILYLGTPGVISGGVASPDATGSTAGLAMDFFAGSGGASSGAGGAVSLTAGAAGGGNANGGNTIIQSGVGAGTGAGGEIDITAGNGGSTGDGGVINIIAGTAGTGGNNAGGYINITASNGQGSGDGGDVLLTAGSGGASGNKGNIYAGGGSGAIGTTSNGGFLMVPHCAGAPTGTPPFNGALVYDTSGNNLYVYNSGWKKIALAP